MNMWMGPSERRDLIPNGICHAIVLSSFISLCGHLWKMSLSFLHWHPANPSHIV